MHTLFENIVVARLLMSQLDRAGGLTFCCSVRIWFRHWTELWRRCGLMVSALVSGSSGPPRCINGYLRIKANICTFTASQDCLSIPIRVYPVIPVNHLISFTGLDLTARFSRKLLNGAKRNCVMKQKISVSE